MARLTKNQKLALSKIEAGKSYTLKEAASLVKDITATKFDASVDIDVRLGVDPRKANQMVRGIATLPHGTGKTQRVLVFAKGDKVKEAEAAGADYVGDEELINKINEGWFDFDIIVATPDMMAEVGKLGRVLGPKGLMPNPRTGTVTFEVEKAVKNIKAGQVEYRVDNDSNLHVPIGKISFDNEKLVENFEALVQTIVAVKPQASKGTYMRNVAVTSTMGPGIKIDTSEYLS